MVFDFKKQFKKYYMPKDKLSIIEVEKMNFIAIKGSGDPNEENGDYQNAIGLLYNVAYTLKMSYKTTYQIEGFYEYVVPPLEGFWWREGICGVDYAHKENFCFIALIRLPDFIKKVDFDWAIKEATRKKKQDYSRVMFYTYDEGLCVQCLHIGSYDDEVESVSKMHQYIEELGYEVDINDQRYHHEIYLSDPRKCDVSKLKTIIRHPIKKKVRKE